MRFKFIFSASAVIVGCATQNTEVDRLSLATVSWGGPRSTLEFNNGTLASWYAFGLKFSGVAFPQVPADTRAQWHPSNFSQLNTETSFFDGHCEAVAGKLAKEKAETCARDCEYDYYVVFGFGTVAGMDFKADGKLIVTCGVVQSPKECATNPETCPFALIKSIGGDFTDAFVASMQAAESQTRLLVNATDSLESLMKQMGYSTSKAVRPGAPSQTPNSKKKLGNFKKVYHKQFTQTVKQEHHEHHEQQSHHKLNFSQEHQKKPHADSASAQSSSKSSSASHVQGYHHHMKHKHCPVKKKHS